MYPNGDSDSDSDSEGYISVFLHIKDTDALPLGWVIYADLKFFIRDMKRDKYLVFQGGENRFHRLKPKCGISKLVHRDVFVDAVNGYLVDDNCVFGVEVFVLDLKFAEEQLSRLVGVGKTFTWKVLDFSKLSSEVCHSNEFTAASLQWRLRLYPVGGGKVKGLSLGLYLELVDPNIPSDGLLVNFVLCISNQSSGEHHDVQCCRWFTSESSCWGCSEFLPLVDLRDSSKCFLVNDCIIVEAHMKNVSIFQ